ncbi:MAG: beta-propeller fold lactonase family protein [Pirellulales bacterium]|nr:beta-propeller fold lactonase family protein [Pirellulales bacterium]
MTRTWCQSVFALAVVLLVAGVAAAEPGQYLGPLQVIASKDGASLYVLNIDGNQISVVETAGGKVSRTIPMPPKPTGMALSPDGAKLYVTCASPEGTVCAVDVASGQTASKLAAGHHAEAPAVTPDGKRLYVCNRFNDNVSVIDLEANKEITRVPVVREPNASAVSPDGKLVVVANLVPNDRADSYDVAAVVTLIDTASNQPANVRLLNGSGSLRGVCVSPDGKYAYVAHILSRYQMPTTQLERGWMNTNALSIIDLAAKKLHNTVLLDDVDLGAANPWGVATTADGAKICVSHGGTHELSVIDTAGLFDKLSKIPADEETARKAGRYDPSGNYSSPTTADVPNDLAFLVDLRERVKLEGNGPRGVAVVGNKAYVAMYFTDSLGVVDLAEKSRYRKVSAIALGPAPQLTVQRRGQMFFHDADLCFQHWQSCSSCHPDARVDALNWDLMNDGMGNPKNTKNMLLAHKTPPSMATGVRGGGEAAVRAGITHIQFAVRPEEDAVAIDEYLKALEPVPSPYLVNGQLSEAAKRGKELFLNEKIGCAKCHPAPLYTDLQMHDVASRGQYDRRDDFDTPTLVECWRTAPFMHDGHWVTLKQLLTEGKHGAKGGDTSGLTEQQINDLVEFVLSL